MVFAVKPGARTQEIPTALEAEKGTSLKLPEKSTVLLIP